jgi:ABC-2 type transport system ATP-binding protein
MDELAIKISNLNKIYPSNNFHALQNIDLQIRKNTVFGLLGPNGAGKSTLINILAGLAIKTSGNINVLGADFDLDPLKIKYLLGVVPQEIALDTFFDVRTALEFHAGYFGLTPEKRKTDEILKALHLSDKSRSTPRMLSGGMKRRLLIAKAMVHSPPILILDEPTAGVDIDLREQLWEYVMELKARGTTIILTTHYLEEAEQLCDDIAFINKGKIILSDKKENLLNTLGSRKMVIECCDIIQLPPSENHDFTLKDNKIIFTFNKNQNINGILYYVLGLGIAIKDIRIEQDDLEGIYKKYIPKSN